ncbi:phBC6A51 family helix-turn-helix protein [Bacteroidota bacterium]
MSKNNTLSTKKQRAIEALSASGNVAEAARVANVSRKTLYRWFRQSDFTEALEVVAQESLANLSRELVRLGTQAVTTLEGAMTDTETVASTKVRAADVVLARLLQLRELVSIESRLTALERKTGSVA